MSINQISQPSSFEQTSFSAPVTQTQSARVDSSLVDKAKLEALGGQRAGDVASNTTQMPTLPQPQSGSMSVLGAWVSMPSPGALVASLIVTDSAEQRLQNKETIRSQSEAIASSMMDQAGKMREAAIKQFACAIASSAVQIGSGAMALGMLGAGSVKVKTTTTTTTTVNNVPTTTTVTASAPKVDAQTLAATVNAATSIMGGVSSALQAGGQFAASMDQASIKEMEASQESIRATRDALRAHNDAINELIAKSLDFMNTMQQNTNQTTSRILA